MRRPIVLDTNVLLVANGGDPAWKPIAAECADRLQRAMELERICVDQLFLILGEYSHKLPSRGRSGFGDMFFLWLMKNKKNPKLCEMVTVTPIDDSNEHFEEFPDFEETVAAKIDRSDRKFIAVANAHKGKPPIVEATDSKWIGWESHLTGAGLSVEYINREFLLRLYTKKMGG